MIKDYSETYKVPLEKPAKDDTFPIEMNEYESKFWKLALDEAEDPRRYLIAARFFLKMVVRVVLAVEKEFGDRGHEVCYEAMRKIGVEVVERAVEKMGLKGKTDLPSFMEVLKYCDRQFFGIRSEITKKEDRDCMYEISFCPVMHHEDIGKRDCRMFSWYFRGMQDAMNPDFRWELHGTVPSGDEKCIFHMFYPEDRYNEKIGGEILAFIAKEKKGVSLERINAYLVSQGLVKDNKEGFADTRLHTYMLRDKNEIILYHEGFSLKEEEGK